MPKDARPEFIESTAGEVAAELARRGIRADQRITVTMSRMSRMTGSRRRAPMPVRR